MKIQAFNWDIEVTEYYVKVNGETVATGYIPTSRSKEPQEQILSDMMAKDEELGLYNQPTDCDGTPLNYGDRIVCVKEFTCKDGLYWEIGYEEYYAHQSLFSSYTTKIKEFTPSELKNFRKVN